MKTFKPLVQKSSSGKDLGSCRANQPSMFELERAYKVQTSTQFQEMLETEIRRC